MKNKLKKGSKIKNLCIILIPLWTLMIGLMLSVLIGLGCRYNNMEKYKKAKEFYSVKEYSKAIDLLDDVGDFEDAYQLRVDAWRNIVFEEGEGLLEEKQYDEAIKKYQIVIDNSYCNDELKTKSEQNIQEIKYLLATKFFNEEQYDKARSLFEELNGYEESDIYIARILTKQEDDNKQKLYDKAISLMNEEKYEDAQELFAEIKDFRDSSEKIQECQKRLYMGNLNHTVAAGVNNSFAITELHKVQAVGMEDYKQCEVSGKQWENIISIDGYGTLTIGLKTDQTVVVAGMYDVDKTVNVESWSGIIDVAAGQQFVAALDKNGQVYADGLHAKNWDLSEWNDVIDIDAGWDFLVGLTKNNELRIKGPNEEFFSDQFEKEKWKDVVCISAGGGGKSKKRRDNGHGHIVGLKKDGSVTAIGDDNHEQCTEVMKDWADVIRISAGDWYTVGLTETGGILITGKNFSESSYIDRSLGKDGLKKLTDCVDVTAGFGQTICLKEDGTVLSFGFDLEDAPNELYLTKQWDHLLVPWSQIEK